MYEARQNKEKVSRRIDGSRARLTQRGKFEDSRVNTITQLMRPPVRAVTVSNNFQTIQFFPQVWKDRIRHGISIALGGAAYNLADLGASKMGIKQSVIKAMLQGAIDGSAASIGGFITNKVLGFIPFFKNENPVSRIEFDNLKNRVNAIELRIVASEGVSSPEDVLSPVPADL